MNRLSPLLKLSNVRVTTSLLMTTALMITTPLVIATAFANERPATNVDQNATPWTEQAITQHIDQSSIAEQPNKQQLRALIKAGEQLFNARFTTLDGVGRPMSTQAIIPTKRRRPARQEFSRTAGLDANACASCHNQPFIGGAGDFSANVFVSEGFNHADFDTTDPQFSNERNTNHLFGAGLIELLAREMSTELIQQRNTALVEARETQTTIKLALQTKGVSFGELLVHADGTVDTHKIEGVDADLIIKPFSQKGVITSLRQFSINALNHHHGMQASERFGARWTGSDDFDEDNHNNEIQAGDISALVAWQASLAPPSVKQNLNADWQQAAMRGSSVFDQLSCNSCHKRSLPLKSLVFTDPGPFDAAGTLRSGEVPNAHYDLAMLDWAKQLPQDENGHWLVPLFGDLKRYVIADKKIATLANELLSQRFVERNVFQTSELWGIADTDPYGHRGDLSTLSEVITAHGGQATDARNAWLALSDNEKSDLTAFLKTLTIQQP